MANNPKLGMIVLYIPGPRDSRMGSDFLPAIVTKVLDDYTLNMTVFRNSADPTFRDAVSRQDKKNKNNTSADPGSWIFLQ